MEDRRGDRPYSLSRCVLVIELVKNKEGSEPFWQVLVSQPRRPNMFTKTWATRTGVIDTKLMQEMLTYIETMAVDAIYASTEIQQALGAVE